MSYSDAHRGHRGDNGHQGDDDAGGRERERYGGGRGQPPAVMSATTTSSTLSQNAARLDVGWMGDCGRSLARPAVVKLTYLPLLVYEMFE